MRIRIAILCSLMGACSALVPIETTDSRMSPVTVETVRKPIAHRVPTPPQITPDANPSDVCRNLDTEDIRETIISKLDCIDQELKK